MPISDPLKGNIPINPAAAVTPKIDDKITELHATHPNPNIPIIVPKIPIPAALSCAALLRK